MRATRHRRLHVALRLPAPRRARAAYLRYFNHKMSREAAVPIDEELESQIRAQQQRVAARWPRHTRTCSRARPATPAAATRSTYYSYRAMLHTWLAACDVRDEHGRPVHLTPHQWRHTFACRLINRDVPQEVVRVLLDHESHEMTAHYARITDQTVRRRWEAATKVNIKGERVTLDPRRASGQAQWAKDPLQHRHPDAAQRLLRAAAATVLPARQRLPDLPGFPHRPRVPARAARTAPPHARPSSMPPTDRDRPGWSR